MRFIVISALALSFASCTGQNKNEPPKFSYMGEKITKTDEEWQKELTEEEYKILRQKGTEMAFTGEYDKHYKDGTYLCAACELPLFDSEHKFNSGSGWPSFYTEIETGNVATETDNAHGWSRTEILCARCGGHLGHVFDDGPAPTGLRYCVNSASLDFKKKENE